ncbi:hypothetical protein M0R45_008171 [Rubus argutus]|uniref:Uncharacterized protein n=1 Tax=Rubus argutus TaxID=59490 RepID=A0AAW1Y2W8_RUBAR
MAQFRGEARAGLEVRDGDLSKGDAGETKKTLVVMAMVWNLQQRTEICGAGAAAVVMVELEGRSGLGSRREESGGGFEHSRVEHWLGQACGGKENGQLGLLVLLVRL